MKLAEVAWSIRIDLSIFLLAATNSRACRRRSAHSWWFFVDVSRLIRWKRRRRRIRTDWQSQQARAGPVRDAESERIVRICERRRRRRRRRTLMMTMMNSLEGQHQTRPYHRRSGKLVLHPSSPMLGARWGGVYASPRKLVRSTTTSSFRRVEIRMELLSWRPVGVSGATDDESIRLGF